MCVKYPFVITVKIQPIFIHVENMQQNTSDAKDVIRRLVEFVVLVLNSKDGMDQKIIASVAKKGNKFLMTKNFDWLILNLEIFISIYI